MRFDPSIIALLLMALFATPEHSAPPERAEFARGGFSVELPDGWTGAPVVDEERYPALATYRLRNTAPGPLAGVEVVVTRRTGLNPMMRERWMQGRAPLDLGTLRPVAALRGAQMPFASGAGFRMAGGPGGALVYFTASGGAHYAVAIRAPAETLAAQEEALSAIARSIRFSAVRPTDGR